MTRGDALTATLNAKNAPKSRIASILVTKPAGRELHPEIALRQVHAQLNSQTPPIVIRALPRSGPVVAWHATGTPRPVQIATELQVLQPIGATSLLKNVTL